MTTDYITPTEAAELIDALPYEYKPILRIAADTGYRIGDICAMKWSDIDWEEQNVTLVEEKTGKERTAGLCPSLLEHLQKHKNRQSLFEVYVFPGNPKSHVNRATVWRWVKKTWGLLYPDSERVISPHSLRKMYAVEQRKRGKSIWDIKTDLNHERDDVTIKYAFADMLGQQPERYTPT